MTAAERLQETIRLLTDLVAFPTVSSDSNRALIDYAADYLAGHGAKLNIWADDSGKKANLFATLGPDGPGGIVLSGHTDVVPVENQEWSSDPFTLRESDGRLYGRGTCDMKGFIAAALATVPHYASLDLKRPLHIALTYDEEVGCYGGMALIDALQQAGIQPSVAIIGEPTEMRLIEGHKGGCEYTTTFTGTDGHASDPEAGVNAIAYAVRYITRLMELADEVKTRAPSVSRFSPPWTSLQVGTISGGIARNVIPGQCTLDWEMRPIQNSDRDFIKEQIEAYVDGHLRPEMQAVSDRADIITETISEIDGLEPVPDNEAVRILSELTGANHTDVVSFGTEAGLFQRLGLSAVVCGPGSIEQAHKPDEFIAISELEKALSVLEKLSRKLV
ncbi:acetylornithine deacetylase [Coralliovum pocilloporae]|uniref:acetylornithine deacetylase n=1 Tax=Coralliovum pocilloporae TaxID=3066369 RepID=UPI0033073EBA